MLPPAEERRSANSNIDCYGTGGGGRQVPLGLRGCWISDAEDGRQRSQGGASEGSPVHSFLPIP
jgi:hypothetical protein